MKYYGIDVAKFVYGDKVYTKLCLNGEKVAEYVFETIADMAELIGKLRGLTMRYKGLARLYVRNITRGWSIERPLMLYPDRY